MADDGTPRRPAGPEPASDAKKHANKLVVLSSVAKEPLNEAESLLGEAKADPNAPPPLPAKKDDGLIRPVGWTTRPGGTTTIIKLPPKTGVLPRLTSLSPKGRQQPPPLPGKDQPAAGDDDTKRLPPIKLHAPTPPATSESESIFSSGSETQAAPAGKKETQPLNAVFASKPASSTSSEAIAKPELRPQPSSPIHHAPPLVAHDASAPVSEEPATPPKAAEPVAAPVESKQAELAKGVDSLIHPAKPDVLPAATVSAGEQVTQRLTPLPGSGTAQVENETRKMRLPPRASTSARLKKAPDAAPGAIEKPDAVATPPKVFPVTPPTIPINPGAAAPPAAATRAPIKATTTPPTIPLRPAPGAAKPVLSPIVPANTALGVSAVLPSADAGGIGDGGKKPLLPSTRAERMRKRRLAGIVAFYILFVALLPCLYFTAVYFSQETRLEGQVIPPSGMLLANEVWIVTDFRDLASGISSDLASDRAIEMQNMQEKLGHVQRAQADVGSREARIRALNDQIKADNQQQLEIVKQAREDSQKIWDGPGAELEADYQSKLAGLNESIAARAKANHLQYQPDPNYFSPEVWANAYRLALYQVPAGVDTVKERLWLDDQMKNWHNFTKMMDQRQNQLREQATQIRLAPAAKVADLKAQVEDLQTRIDGTLSEEEPLKAELEQAQTDLAAVQAKESGLDAKPMQKLDALPDTNITMRLPLASNGRFSWRQVEKASKYAEDEKSHVYWIFARAYRSDGRQYWAMSRFSLDKNTTQPIFIEPGSFISTKAILRPDLSPDEQAK